MMANKPVTDERLEELARLWEWDLPEIGRALRELQRRRAGDAETETLRRERDEARAMLEGVRRKAETYRDVSENGDTTCNAVGEEFLRLLDAPAPAAPALFCDVDPSIRVGIRDWILDALEGDDTFEGMCVRDWLNGLRVIDPDAHAPAEAAALDLGTLTVQTTLTPELAKLLYPAAVETAKEDESDE